jgi:hypothetical protein
MVGGFSRRIKVYNHHLVGGFKNVFFHNIIWVNYNDLTATSLGIMINKGNHPQLALFPVSEIL